jgi:hypothetical protein
MAQLAEATRSPSALLLRSRVVELNPHSLEDRLALAQTALEMRDYLSATNALEGVDPADKKTAVYQNLAGAVASAANQISQAEMYFLEASRLEPQNPAPQLNLAVVRLHSTNAVELGEARAALQRLASNPTNSTLRCRALRELTIDAMSHKQRDLGLLLSRQLVQETNSNFTDRMLRLEVLRDTTNADFKPTLATFQREATTNQSKVVELATWEMAKTSPKDALAWLLSLPENTQTNQSIAVLIAEADTVVANWTGLQHTIENQNWAELDFIRHAFLARALRGQDLTASSQAQWEQALKLANGQKARLVMLLRLAAKWKWESEGEDILWNVVNNYPGEKWAFAALSRALFIDGRTRSLMQLYDQESKRDPSSLDAKNNLAMTALLLNAQELKPQELAREVYEKQPTNSTFAATYAFSLYMGTNSAAAQKVLEKLNPRDLERPSIADCYGLVLQANGNAAKARKYLELSTNALFLPEERRLVEKARTGV